MKQHTRASYDAVVAELRRVAAAHGMVAGERSDVPLTGGGKLTTFTASAKLGVLDAAKLIADLDDAIRLGAAFNAVSDQDTGEISVSVLVYLVEPPTDGG